MAAATPREATFDGSDHARAAAEPALRYSVGVSRIAADSDMGCARRERALHPRQIMAKVPSPESLTLAPTADPRAFRAETGEVLRAPTDWAHLPPGDAGLTRRVKAAGPSWTVVEEVGNKTFSRGVWAPLAHIEAARGALEVERASPKYQKRRAADGERRKREHETYAASFEQEVRAFLRFAPCYSELEATLAERVAAHATPVGSGTVARTERISIDRRAEAAVIAWMRHQTTAYERLSIPRARGMRRQVRRDLAQVSRSLLDLHRRDSAHTKAACPLCRALAAPAATAPPAAPPPTAAPPA